jgi:Sister chromatid cohesion protein Dcc1
MNIFNPPPPPDSTAAANDRPPVSLLTLPRAELIGPSDASSAPSSLLLQLPLHWTVGDFINHQSSTDLSNTYFVSNRNEPSQQVACVVESKGTSFTVHRVETSNVLVLVPPPSSTNGKTEMNAINDTHNNDDTTDPSPAKITQHIPAHLLKAGGSGAFFLELRPKRLRRSTLREALPTFDPSHTNRSTPLIGRTICDLAGTLQLSQSEVQRGLSQILAFHLPRTDPMQYALLTDSILQDCYHAVLDGLILFGVPSEDYAGVGIEEAASFVDFVIQQVFSEEERFPDLDCVVHHCLHSLQATTSEDDPETGCILDVAKVRKACNNNGYLACADIGPFSLHCILLLSKVAKMTARRLFLKHPEPWPEVDFFTAWQSELPGKGAIYQVQRTMLRGVAVSTGFQLADMDDFEKDTLNSERFWHFLPVESISTDPTQCFTTLFALKERWCMYELEPYLDHLVEASFTTTSSAELLLRHSNLIREDHDGAARTLYQTK